MYGKKANGKRTEYIQIYKNNWEQNKAEIHFEILFETNLDDSRLIGFKKVPIDIELHIEGNLPDDITKELENNKIGYNRQSNNYYRGRRAINLESGEEITIKEADYDFSTNEEIDNSIQKMIKRVEELQEKYSEIINKIFE